MASFQAQAQNTPGDKAADAICALSVKGYKSLVDETRLEVRPLTILAGANSSGKSSVMQPFLLLKQTLEATFDPGALLLDGPNVKCTSADQILPKPPLAATDGFCLRIGIDGAHEAYLSLRFERQSPVGFELAEMVATEGQSRFPLKAGMESSDIAQVLHRAWQSSTRAGAPDSSDRKEFINHLIAHSGFQLSANRCFFEIDIEIAGVLTKPMIPTSFEWLKQTFQWQLRRIIHVPGLRGNPERTYRTTAVGRQFPGTFETYVASIIHHWKATNDERLQRLAEALQALGLTWKIDARTVDDTRVELQVGRLPKPKRGGAKDLVSIADVGFGVSQVLPVLVALLAAEPGQLVYIEQPEIHLHPRAQIALAGLLADAAQRGVRVVAETHSHLLLLGVQTETAEGRISPDLIKLHWFQRRDDGSTQITSADLDDEGAYGDWPEDFGDVALRAESRYLDAAGSNVSK